MPDPRLFAFDSYGADLCTGRFYIDPRMLRRAFKDLGKGFHFYECRRLSANGTSTAVGLMDPWRRTFEERCLKYGSGDDPLSILQTFLEPGTGLILNSLHDPNTRRSWAFNEIASAFLANLNFLPNKFPEELDVVIFLGSYNSGFGLHRDDQDVTMFVLDGTKHFIVDVQGEPRAFVIRAGEYLRWSSPYAHTNSNPNAEWSISLHISVGPSASRKLDPGTPVEYIYPATKLKTL